MLLLRRERTLIQNNHLASSTATKRTANDIGKGDQVVNFILSMGTRSQTAIQSSSGSADVGQPIPDTAHVSIGASFEICK